MSTAIATPANTPRIFCIGRNYAEHIAELGDMDASRCVVFMKSPSCVVHAGEAVHLPHDRGAVHHEAELVVQIGRAGHDIDEQSALQHVSALTLGLDLTLRDLQNELKAQGAPWERCKAFDNSAPLGDWVAYDSSADVAALQFQCEVNGELRQQGDTGNMLVPVPALIAMLSKTWRLHPGDIIFTGTPKGVGPLVAGDVVTLSSPSIGTFDWNMV